MLYDHQATMILLHRRQVALEMPSDNGLEPIDRLALGTVVANFVSYGFAPSKDLYDQLTFLAASPSGLLAQHWQRIESGLKELKGDDKDVGKHVVYQNFPKEVLDMSEAEYWIRQIFIYMGLSYEAVREVPIERPPLDEELDLAILHLAGTDALEEAWVDLILKRAAWTSQEKNEVNYLLENGFDVSEDIPFKENLVHAAVSCFQNGKQLVLKTATDVLRLAAGLSEGDVSLKENTPFRLSRPKRRFILELLDQAGDLPDGLMRYPERWKRLFHTLHVGEYKASHPRLFEMANSLRKGERFATWNTRVEEAIANRDLAVLELLAVRPGEFARRLQHCLKTFGERACTAFIQTLDQLESMKLLKLKKYLQTANKRKFRTFTPKGNWSKLQVVENEICIDEELSARIVEAIDDLLKTRMQAKWGDKFQYDSDIARVKFPVNDKEAVSRFTKGTVISIPNFVKFIRTATYWETVEFWGWMDNSWNFFDSNWEPMGSCCWNATHEMKSGAVFSGDPVWNPKDGGRTAQLIDIYPQKLRQQGVRYAVWNILSYSHIPFDKASDVRGLFLWGKDPAKGKLIEPSCVTFAFPVTGNSLTKYLVMLDLDKRELVLTDTGLYGNVGSAKANETVLQDKMPALLEYIDAIPSLADLLELFPVSHESKATKILYSDKNVSINDENAFVFLPQNDDNTFKPIGLNELIDI